MQIALGVDFVVDLQSSLLAVVHSLDAGNLHGVK